MKGYIFLSRNSEKTEFMLMQSNNEFLAMKTWVGELDNSESIDALTSWIGDPAEYRFVAKSIEDFNMFAMKLNEFNKVMTRDYVRIIKSRFWNIQHEMAYRLKCPKEFAIEDFLELYGLTEIAKGEEYVAECVELHMLANAFHSDKKRYNEITQNGYLDMIRTELSKLPFEMLFYRGLKKYNSLHFKSTATNKTYLEAFINSETLICIESVDPKSALVDLFMKKFEKFK